MVIKKIFTINKRAINLIATKLSINYQKSEQIFFDVLEHVKNKTKNDPSLIFRGVIRKLTPPLKTKPKKIAGRIYMLPAFQRKESRISLAFSYVLKAVTNTITGVGLTLEEKIAQEIIKVFEGTSGALALSYKEELIKVLKDNRPFVRIRRRRMGKKGKKKRRRRRRVWFKFRKKKHLTSRVFTLRPFWYAKWRILPAHYRNKKYGLRIKKKRLILNRPVKLVSRKFRWKLKLKRKRRVANFKLYWRYRSGFYSKKRKFKKLPFLKKFTTEVTPLFRILSQYQTRLTREAFDGYIKSFSNFKKILFYLPKRRRFKKRHYKKHKNTPYQKSVGRKDQKIPGKKFHYNRQSKDGRGTFGAQPRHEGGKPYLKGGYPKHKNNYKPYKRGHPLAEVNRNNPAITKHKNERFPKTNKYH